MAQALVSRLCGCLALCCLLGNPAQAQAPNDEAALNFLLALSSDQDWRLLQSTPLDFDVYHPQGMTRVGDSWFMSSVEVIERSQRITDDNSPYDRSPGRGIGHLFKFDRQGGLLARTTLGEGHMFHPGGMDYDGEYLWLSVAEYRPDSHSIVYRVDPDTLTAEEVLRFDDHLGALLRNTTDGSLVGVSWGSRTLYRWPQVSGANDAEYGPQRVESKRKTDSDVDYQDCQQITARAMACSGISSRTIDNTHVLTIGGIEVVDLDTLEVQHKIRVTGTTPGYTFLTRNPFYFSYSENDRGSFYFVPEDERATLYHYAPGNQ